MKRLKSLALLALVVSPVDSSPFNYFSKRNATGEFPIPISVAPTEEWAGIDGQWNTFALRIGTPAQIVRVYISTTSQQTWAVHPLGCSVDFPGLSKANCPDSRGGLYNSSASSSYVNNGIYSLYIEGNLNYTGNAQFGYDTIGLGFNGQGGPTLEHQIIGAEAVKPFWYGHFGIHPKTTNFTDFSENVPSFMSTLKAQRMIPSVSWGYTQGAAYRFSKVYSSLTLGGFDRNRIITNTVLFPMAADNDRDILVNINNITTDFKIAGNSTLLDQPVYAFIDSTVAELWLPLSTCQLFEQAFNLTYDTKSTLYLIDDDQHDNLLKLNPNVTFTLSPAPEFGRTVQITLPYAAFDLTAKPPYHDLAQNTRYFPLKRATNETQYTLGRTFLQEAYLTVDWERQNFYVSQCNWVPNLPEKIVAIEPLHTFGSPKGREGASKPLETGAIVGIVVAIVALAGIIVTLSVLLFRSNRRSKRAAEAKERELAAKNGDDGSDKKNGTTKAELDAGDDATRKVFEKDTVEHVVASPVENAALQEAPPNAIFELPGDTPPNPEADSRELTEKEAMRVREARYNGIANPVPKNTRPIVPLGPLPPVIKRLSPSDKVSLARARRHSLVGPIPPPPHPPPQYPLPPTPASPIEGPEEGSNGISGSSSAEASAGATQRSPVSPVTPGTGTTGSTSSMNYRLHGFVSPISATENRNFATELGAAPRSNPSSSKNSTAESREKKKAALLSVSRKVDKRASDSKINIESDTRKRFSWEG